MGEKTILVWFRNDLRIHDNEILLEALKKADKIVPVYCFDPEYFTTTSINTQKTGTIRAKFIIESVADLKRSLQNLGGDLVVRFGKPEEVLPQLVQQYAVAEVYHHREVASEETDISARVEAALWKLRINLKHFIGHTMYHKEDLPFPIKDIPDVFATFKKKIERESVVRPCLQSPETICVPEGLEAGTIPTLDDLGLSEQPEGNSVIDFKGGETVGLRQIEEFFNTTDQKKESKNTQNGLISKLSPWISLGCLSTRKVYWEMKANEHKLSRETVNWLTLELLRRDYFRFMFKKYSAKFSSAKEIAGFETEKRNAHEQIFNAWKNGETGIPFIDATINELNTTGYVANHGRQALANYLINNLGADWTFGAAYFEEKLIDYSPASNWGNWSYLADAMKIETDSIESALKQGLISDPNGDYIRKWVPALKGIPDAQIHQPWKLSADDLEKYAVGVLYSHPEAVANL
jgi:deoxyribodipyrimidine photo-lyase